ncbi:MAG TPA: EAL domain-containing protein [Chloroflexota bacterium]
MVSVSRHAPSDIGPASHARRSFDALAHQLRTALHDGRLVVAYQPIVSLVDRRVVHYEALLRLPGPRGALLPAAAFIPVATRLGLLPAIDRWVVRHVLRHLAHQREATVYVNLSGQSLDDPALLATIEAGVRRSPLAPGQLGFEITETTAVRHPLRVRRWMERMRRRGCRFALDDFGVGYNSLRSLRDLPVDLLKLDGSFVRGLAGEPGQQRLVHAIAAFAAAMALDIVAEHVETEDTLLALRAAGISWGQGYLLGRPRRWLPLDTHPSDPRRDGPPWNQRPDRPTGATWIPPDARPGPQPDSR